MCSNQSEKQNNVSDNPLKHGVKMVLNPVVSALSSSTGSTGMSVAKTTVDKLLKGYDIRLRPDFGGTYCALHLFWGLQLLLEGVYKWRFVQMAIYESFLRNLWVFLWQNIGSSFEVTTTMSLLIIYSHMEDGCSSRSRTHIEMNTEVGTSECIDFFIPIW